jgi:hypothetical protein
MLGLDARHGDQQGDMQIVFVEAAVFGDLRSAGEDHACVGFHRAASSRAFGERGP